MRHEVRDGGFAACQLAALAGRWPIASMNSLLVGQEVCRFDSGGRRWSGGHGKRRIGVPVSPDVS